MANSLPMERWPVWIGESSLLTHFRWFLERSKFTVRLSMWVRNDFLSRLAESFRACDLRVYDLDCLRSQQWITRANPSETPSNICQSIVHFLNLSWTLAYYVCDEFRVHFGLDTRLTNKLQCTDILSKCGFFSIYTHTIILRNSHTWAETQCTLFCCCHNPSSFACLAFILGVNWNSLEQSNECCKNAKIFRWMHRDLAKNLQKLHRK